MDMKRLIDKSIWQPETETHVAPVTRAFHLRTAVREGRKEFIPSVNLSFDVTPEKWGYLGLGATWSNMFSGSLEVDVSSVSNSKCLILISVSSHLSDCSVTAIFLCRCLFSSPLIVLSQNVTSRNSFSSLAFFPL